MPKPDTTTPARQSPAFRLRTTRTRARAGPPVRLVLFVVMPVIVGLRTTRADRADAVEEERADDEFRAPDRSTSQERERTHGPARARP
ncbi:hypothetical protein GCM10010398_59560 [Streptomyces fimbriatus]